MVANRPRLPVRLGPWLVGVAALAACQGTPTPVTPIASPSVGTAGVPSADATVPAPTAAPTATATPVPVATATIGPAATPTAKATVTAYETVLGNVFNEGGAQIENAMVEVKSDDPAYNKVISAAGGSFALRDVPVGTSLSLRAFAEGYTTRTRTLKVRTIDANEDDTPNRVDFGGLDGGMLYYLTEYPDITSTEPSNLSKLVAGDKLEIKLHVSHPLRLKDTDGLRQLVQVRFQAPGGDEILKDGLSYRQERAKLEWNADNTEATFTFGAPLVNYNDDAAVTVTMDRSLDAKAYPIALNNRRLGRDVVPNARDGTGSVDSDQVAAFARPILDEKVPTALPSPLTLWGLTHHTTVRFTLTRDSNPLKVIKAEAFKALPGQKDSFELTFNKPVRGFPESALRPEITAKNSYRYVSGKTQEREDRENFAEKDPRLSGTPPASVTFDEHNPRKLFLNLQENSLDGQTHFKLYVDPKIEDVAGAKLDDTNGQSIEGEIQ